MPRALMLRRRAREQHIETVGSHPIAPPAGTVGRRRQECRRSRDRYPQTRSRTLQDGVSTKTNIGVVIEDGYWCSDR